MGTHPIFESDFDCLTDLVIISVLSVIVELAAFAAFECICYFDNQSNFGGHPDPAEKLYETNTQHINYWTYRRRKKKISNSSCQRNSTMSTVKSMTLSTVIKCLQL